MVQVTHAKGCPAHVALLYWPEGHVGGGQAVQVKLPPYCACVHVLAGTSLAGHADVHVRQVPPIPGMYNDEEVGPARHCVR